MIDGSRILTILNLQNLATRLGVKGIVTAALDPVVHPVAIVDGSITAFTQQPLDVPFTAGELTAPIANTRLASTGPLVAGQYNLTFMESAAETHTIRVRRRNAADAADIWSQRFTIFTPGGIQSQIFTGRLILAAGELVVVENVNAGGGGIVYQASIWVQGPF
jgi:hypothetical protein